MAYVAAGALAVHGVAGAILWAIWKGDFGNRPSGQAAWTAAELHMWLVPSCATIAAIALAGFAPRLPDRRALRRAALFLAFVAALALIPWVHSQLTSLELTESRIMWMRVSFFSTTAFYAAAMVALAIGILRSCRGGRLGLLCRSLAAMALLDAALGVAFEVIDGLRRLAMTGRIVQFSMYVLSPAVALNAATVLALAAVGLRRVARPASEMRT